MEQNGRLNAIIDKYKGRKGALIPLLQEVQVEENYLSRETMRYVSERTKINLAEIYGVATFYTMFRLKPQGKHVIRVCKGTACHVSNADSILNELREKLNLTEDKDTTDDGMFTLMEVACIGCCSLAPVIMVDDNTHGKLTAKAVSGILKKYV